MLFHVALQNCFIAHCIWVNMMDVKLAQEPADIVWCYWDTGRLCGPSPQPAGKLCLCTLHTCD